MKKIFLLLICCIALVGCSKKEQPVDINAHRVGDFAYDFIEYLDIQLYGANGQGFIEIAPKEFTVKDFQSEADYIGVRKKLDTINPNFKQGTRLNSYLEIMPNTDLSNGDMVMVSLKSGYIETDTGVSVNLNPYFFEVQGLSDGVAIDLFSDTSVTFYGLENSDKIYYHKQKGGMLNDELVDNLVYTATPNSSPLMADQTILSVTATLKDEFLNDEDRPFYNIDVYMTKNNYIYKTQTDKVLNEIVKPLDYNGVNELEVQSVLYDYFYKETFGRNNQNYQLDSISNIQQAKGAADKYNATATMMFSADGFDDICARSVIKLIRVDGDYILLDASRIESVNVKYCNEAFDGHEIVVDYNMNLTSVQDDQ